MRLSLCGYQRGERKGKRPAAATQYRARRRGGAKTSKRKPASGATLRPCVSARVPSPSVWGGLPAKESRDRPCDRLRACPEPCERTGVTTAGFNGNGESSVRSGVVLPCILACGAHIVGAGKHKFLVGSTLVSEFSHNKKTSRRGRETRLLGCRDNGRVHPPAQRETPQETSDKRHDEEIS